MKKKYMRYFFCVLSIVFLSTSCTDKNVMLHDPYQLKVHFSWDENAERQDNIGNPSTVPAENSSQTPIFEEIGIHFLGIYPDKFTPYSAGETLLSTPTTEAGGIAAIDFENEWIIDSEQKTLSIDLSKIEPGIYEYLRSSLAFQKYQVSFNLKGADLPAGMDDDIDVDGHVASFLGYNTYIENYKIKNKTISVGANKLQGYFGLESIAEIQGTTYSEVFEGEAGQITVPNPISASSPVPPGSCVVTGKFPSPLIIPAEASADIEIEVVISINNSFEWKDPNGNGKYEPLLGEEVVDMGTRGFFPKVL